MKIKRFTIFILLVMMAFSLAACGTNTQKNNTSENTPSSQTQEEMDTSDFEEASDSKNDTADLSDNEESSDSGNDKTDSTILTQELTMKINETEVIVSWEDNESVAALNEMCKKSPLTIQMSMYGGFEQVGSIGKSLPRSDKQMTTTAGDIVLYSGSNIVVFYGSNSWSYTKLGRITDKSAAQLREMLSNGNVTITIEAKEK